jgi:hypothetical protein
MKNPRQIPTITHTEAQLVVLTKAAIGAMNDLILYLNDHPELLPVPIRRRIIEADYLLNSSEDYYIVHEDQLDEVR